jgi:hypothetical protein
MIVGSFGDLFPCEARAAGYTAKAILHFTDAALLKFKIDH